MEASYRLRSHYTEAAVRLSALDWHIEAECRPVAELAQALERTVAE